VQTASQEAWPEADLGDEILPEMRAAVERRQACALRKSARRVARCGGGTLRLPAFRSFIFFVARVEQSETRGAAVEPNLRSRISLRSIQATKR
jgi:hypothetical protein